MSLRPREELEDRLGKRTSLKHLALYTGGPIRYRVGIFKISHDRWRSSDC
jgi:hypothetical protein